MKTPNPEGIFINPKTHEDILILIFWFFEKIQNFDQMADFWSIFGQNPDFFHQNPDFGSRILDLRSLNFLENEIQWACIALLLSLSRDLEGQEVIWKVRKSP